MDIVKVYTDIPRCSLDIKWDYLGMANTCQYALNTYEYAPKTLLLLPGHGKCLQRYAKSLPGHGICLTVRHNHALGVCYPILRVSYHVYWDSEYVHIEIYYVQRHFIMSREQQRCLGSMLSCLGSLLTCLESFIPCLLSPSVCPGRLLACFREHLPYLGSVNHVMGAC
jgi:hypothetical protein